MAYDSLHKNKPFQGNLINPFNLAQSIQHPLVWIISLTSDKDLDNKIINKLSKKNIIDIIWAIDGLLTLPNMKENGSSAPVISNILGRPKNDSYSNITSSEWKNYINGKEYEFFYGRYTNRDNPEKILINAIGWLTNIFYLLTRRTNTILNKLNVLVQRECSLNCVSIFLPQLQI